MNSFDEKIQPFEALQGLECLYNDTTAVWTSDTTRMSRHRSVDASKLKLSKVRKRHIYAI